MPRTGFISEDCDCESCTDKPLLELYFILHILFKPVDGVFSSSRGCKVSESTASLPRQLAPTPPRLAYLVTP